MNNWTECQQGFWLPINHSCDTYADFDDLTARLLDAPDLEDIIIVGDTFRPPKWAWARWQSAFDRDQLPRLGPDLELGLARRKYESARFVALVPAWKRAMISWLTEIDDIEDQLATVLVVLEWVSKKVIPLPRGLLAGARDVKNMLDRAETLLAGIPLDRRSKVEWHSAQRDALTAKRNGRRGVAKLLDWLKQNWGKILEAAQATNTWFDVGIVLGPIMGYVTEGSWALARETVNNYLIAIDTFAPGYKEAFDERADELGTAIENVMNQVWEDMTTRPDVFVESLLGLPPETFGPSTPLVSPDETNLIFP